MRKKIGFVIALLASFGLGFLFCHMWWRETPAPEKQVTAVVTPAPAVVTTPQQEAVVAACVDTSYTVPPKGNRINSLWRIAESVYGGRAYLYPLIAEVNGINSPYVIQPGQVLKIPMNLCNLPELPKAPVRTRVVSKETASPKAEVASTPAEKPVVETTPVVPTPAPVVVVPAQASPAPVVAVVPSPVAPATAVASNEGIMTTAPQAQAVRPSLEVNQLSGRVPSDTSLEKLTPGSIWNSFVTNPIESENWVNYFHVDQGVILGRPVGVSIQPYVALNVVQDTKGFQWNNRAKAEAGLKFGKPFANGVINISGAYASERREEIGLRPSETRSNFILYTDGWFGRDQPTNSSARSYFSNTPGTVWWIVGNVSPSEKGNVIGLARGEQGITAVKAKGVSLIPLGWAQAGFDTQDKPWNRRYTLGGGLSVKVPWNTGVVGIQGGYECTRNYGEKITSSGATCGPAVKVDFWNGWRKIGGK